MKVRQQFKGKRILITGTTGFLGKVLLEKFLYSLSCCEKIYLLIRAKEGSNLFQRFKKEIISSQCFDRLRSVHKGRFDQFVRQKVQPIQGDLTKQKLGLTAEDEDQITSKCHIIINCAASIDFNARLDAAIDSNIKGSLQMLELARKCVKLELFTHISTCYVNCDMSGLVKEEIYQRQTEPEQEYRQLQETPLNELIAKTTQILGLFPNTYTYTKNLCQRLMRKRRLNVPVCIVRPAIINTSYNEPFPGWIDSLAAAAALFLFVGLGIVRELKADMKKIGDVIPVDMVSSLIIVATAFNLRNTNFSIYHVGSSDLNPLTWGEMQEEVQGYWNSTISPSKIGKSHVLMSTSQYEIDIQKLKRKIPLEVYLRLSPLLGKQHQKNAQKMVKTLKRGDEVSKMFDFFVNNDWVYECRNLRKLLSQLNPEEKKIFFIDIADIDFKKYIRINNYGLQKYILKENAEEPIKQNSNLLRMHSQDDYFCDLKWALNTHMPIRPMSQIRTKILSSSRVLKAIEYEIQQRIQNLSLTPEKAKRMVRNEAEKLINDLIAEVKVPVMRSMAWTLHKALKGLYEKISINVQAFEQIREIQKNSEIPIVLLPTHRSYLDFLIISYVFFVYNLRLPNFIADEAILQAKLIPFLIKSCGAFFFQKTPYKESALYRTIFDKYVELLLRQGNTIEFFIEGSRSRTGKILAPRFQILNVVLDSVVLGKVSNVCFIPMTVNYEKVLEGDTFPGQLLGEEMLAESLWRVMKALPQLKVNHGRVFIQICKPVLAKDLIREVQSEFGDNKGPEMRKKCVKVVGRQIIGRMTGGIVIMSTAIVSSVLLMHRKGISQDELIKTVNQLVKYILQKGHKVGGVNENSSAVAVRNAIVYLQGITTKTKKNIFELTISAGSQFQKILMLSYYRNTLTHAFLPEAFVGCAIAAFGQQLYSNEGIPLSRIHEQTCFLMSLLREEYFIEYSLESYEDFMKVITLMQDNLVIEIKDVNKVIISSSSTGARMIAFYCSLLRSQVECYWACLVYILTLARSHDNRYETSSLDKFYDTIQWFMESLYSEKVIQDYEACSLETIKNAFEKYQKQKFVRLVSGSKKKGSVVEVLLPWEQLEGFENKIKFFRKSVYSSFISPTEVAKQSLRDLGTPRL